MPSLGEYRVGIDFNPSGNKDVHKLKRLAADFIEACANLRADQRTEDKEIDRLFDLAMTLAEDAAMWAVKAVTKRPF